MLHECTGLQSVTKGNNEVIPKQLNTLHPTWWIKYKPEVHKRHQPHKQTLQWQTKQVVTEIVLCNTINTTQYCDTKVVALTSKFVIIGTDYAI